MTALRLIPGEGRRLADDTGPMRLHARSRRPGLAHEELDLSLDRSTAERVVRRTAGLPPPLWAVIAIESERALGAATRADESDAVLARRLDWAARRTTPNPRRRTQLAAYAAALRQPPATSQPAPARTPLGLLVPYHTLLVWDIAADQDGVSLANWARARLAAVEMGRPLWEAAAAEAGQMLAEWVALRAAKPR